MGCIRVCPCVHIQRTELDPLSPVRAALRKGSHLMFLLSQALDFHEPWPILVPLRDPQ